MKQVIPLRQQIVALRKKRGLSQRALSQLVGVSQPVIADFESQHRTSLRLAMRIAEALDAEIRVELVDRRKTKKNIARRSQSSGKAA
ncbi:MAG: helix-turn-helix domain-containing protein [Candidatus Binatia bacterium]